MQVVSNLEGVPEKDKQGSASLCRFHLLRKRELVHSLLLVDMGTDGRVLLESVGNSLAILDEDLRASADSCVGENSVRLGSLGHVLFLCPLLVLTCLHTQLICGLFGTESTH